jgi:hypothetical protein
MANIITGAKAIVKIDGKVAGYATGISIQESQLNGRVESLGFIDSREITPISRIVTATINFIRIFKTNDRNGLSADEADEGSMITTEQTPDGENPTAEARTNNALTSRPFDLELYDSAAEAAAEGELQDGDKKIYTVVGCRPSSQSIVVDRGSLMGVQVSVDALYLIRHPDGLE